MAGNLADFDVVMKKSITTRGEAGFTLGDKKAKHDLFAALDSAFNRVEAMNPACIDSTSAYRARECYAGVAECSVYVAGTFRGRGAGALVLQAVIDAAAAAGFWKLVSRIFVENAASRALVQRCGFREVGVYRRHARLDGVWRDVVIVERLLA